MVGMDVLTYIYYSLLIFVAKALEYLQKIYNHKELYYFIH